MSTLLARYPRLSLAGVYTLFEGQVVPAPEILATLQNRPVAHVDLAAEGPANWHLP